MSQAKNETEQIEELKTENQRLRGIISSMISSLPDSNHPGDPPAIAIEALSGARDTLGQFAAFFEDAKPLELLSLAISSKKLCQKAIKALGHPDNTTAETSEFSEQSIMDREKLNKIGAAMRRASGQIDIDWGEEWMPYLLDLIESARSVRARFKVGEFTAQVMINGQEHRIDPAYSTMHFQKLFHDVAQRMQRSTLGLVIEATKKMRESIANMEPPTLGRPRMVGVEYWDIYNLEMAIAACESRIKDAE